MRSYGDKNKDIKFGILEMSVTRLMGFAAYARLVLAGLLLMDEKGLIPYIDIKSRHYTEKHKINGTLNVYEYFFEQPCDVVLNRHISRKEILQSANVEILSEADIESVNEANGERGFYYLFNNYELLKRMAAILHKYIRINRFSSGVYQEIKDILGDDIGKTIGIHVRRGDFKGINPGHPIAVDPIEHLNIFKRIRNNRKAFLATDDEEVIAMYANNEEGKMGHVIWYKDVLRTPKELSDENISIYSCEEKRENHKYRLGYEILKDILTLSYCDSLIAGYSNVALLAKIIKISRGEEFTEYYIIDKGFREMNGDYRAQYYKQQIKASDREVHPLA